MRFSSKEAVVVVAALGLAVFAGCVSEADSVFSTPYPSDNKGGSGGEAGKGGGGSGGEGGKTGSSSSSSSSSSASSSSSGGVNPQACGSCSFQACQAEIFACGQACQGFAGCIQGCMDSVCANDCITKFPEGKPIYDCTCKSCTNDCGGLCPAGSSTSSSSSSSSGAMCSKCGDFLQGNLGTPCPGSDQKIFALYSCTCNQNCPMQCGAVCQGGGTPDQTCLGCVALSCGQELQACVQD